MTAAVIIFFILASVQIGRFLIHERFVQMEVTSDSEQASVFLDGKFLGRAAAGKQTFPNIVSGEHTVEIRGATDKGIHHEVLRFQPGQIVLIDASLPDRNTVVTLSASSEPEGAALYLNNQLIGTTPLRRLRLKSGSHSVKLEKEGFLPITEKINLEKSQSYSVRYRLTQD